MADGYARASGRVGVCMATSGPGATNLVTGLATAHMDSSPVVAITGQVSTAILGRDGFQEADITGITMPVTKHNYLVTDVNELPAVMMEAFYIASTGPPRTGADRRLPRRPGCHDRRSLARSRSALPGYQPNLLAAPQAAIEHGGAS